MSEFLVVYDYGMGGVWGFATAESELDLTQTFPELQVIHEIPQWMTGDVEAKVRTASSFDVNDPGTYPEWLRGVVRGRTRMDRE